MAPNEESTDARLARLEANVRHLEKTLDESTKELKSEISGVKALMDKALWWLLTLLLGSFILALLNLLVNGNIKIGGG